MKTFTQIDNELKEIFNLEESCEHSRTKVDVDELPSSKIVSCWCLACKRLLTYAINERQKNG
jgi:hypothetical protein